GGSNPLAPTNEILFAAAWQSTSAATPLPRLCARAVRSRAEMKRLDTCFAWSERTGPTMGGQKNRFRRRRRRRGQGGGGGGGGPYGQPGPHGYGAGGYGTGGYGQGGYGTGAALGH